jgi:hypothetical protein
MRMMGLMEDFSKGECLRISALLKKRIEAGKAKKLSRGVYTAVYAIGCWRACCGGTA